MGETSRSIKKRNYEHEMDNKIGNKINALVKHNLETHHILTLKIPVHNKQHRKIIESRIISNHYTIKQKPIF